MTDKPNSELTPGLLLNIKSYLTKPKKILIVEDDVERIRWFHEHLAPGHQTTIATNGEAAFSVLKSDQQWDLIFLDHDLNPEHIEAAGHIKSFQDYNVWVHNYNGFATGFDIACWLSQQNWTKQTPVIIHSMNPQGSAAIKSILSDFRSMQIPFEDLKESY